MVGPPTGISEPARRVALSNFALPRVQRAKLHWDAQGVVSYCLQVLQLFEGMDQQRFLAVLSEVAAVGQGGLQINAPGTKSLPQEPARQLERPGPACLIQYGHERLMPDEDSGLGIRAEQEEAARLHRAGGKTP